MADPFAPQNLLDRAIEVVAPQWALNRGLARARKQEAQASYRGAIATRSSHGLPELGTSYRGGRLTERRDQATMCSRARRTFRENAVAKSLLNTETDNVMAEGFVYQPGSANKDWNREAIDRFWAWLERADVAGMWTSADWFRGSWREPRKDGDGAILLIKRSGRPYLQYIPRDLIQNPYARFDYRTMKDGVECDEAGKPIQFWIRDIDEAGKDVVSPFPARDVVYIAHLTNPLDVRGSTVYEPIFELLEEMDTYRGTVTRASIMACIFGLIEKRVNPGATLQGLGTEANAAGVQQRAISLSTDGQLKIIGEKDSVFQIQAQQPMQNTPEFIRTLSRIAAIGFDMPLEVALRDLSQVNFSGGQLGMKGYERTCRVRQDWIKSKAWNRIVFWWLSVERQRQQLEFGDAFKAKFPDDYGVFELHPREWLLRDRLGEAKADLMEIAIGKSSPQRACGQSGVEYRELLAQRAEAWKDNEAAGLPNVLPTDTRDAKLAVTAIGDAGQPAPAPSANGSDSSTNAVFNQRILATLAGHESIGTVIFNASDAKAMMSAAGVSTKADATQPLLPVTSNGKMVSGDRVYDADGELIGGDVEHNLPDDASPPSTPAEST